MIIVPECEVFPEPFDVCAGWDGVVDTMVSLP